MHVIAQIALCWNGVSLAFAAPLALLGYRRKQMRRGM